MFVHPVSLISRTAQVQTRAQTSIVIETRVSHGLQCGDGDVRAVRSGREGRRFVRHLTELRVRDRWARLEGLGRPDDAGELVRNARKNRENRIQCLRSLDGELFWEEGLVEPSLDRCVGTDLSNAIMSSSTRSSVKPMRTIRLTASGYYLISYLSGSNHAMLDAWGRKLGRR